MRYLVSAFTPAMVGGIGEKTITVRFSPIMASEVPDCESAIGHSGTADIVSKVLGHEVLCARTTLRLQSGDEAYIFQLLGPRPAEGKVLSAEEIAERFLRKEITFLKAEVL